MEQSVIKQTVQRDCNFTATEPFETRVEVARHLFGHVSYRVLVSTDADDATLFFIVTRVSNGDVDAMAVDNYDQGIRIMTNFL